MLSPPLPLASIAGVTAVAGEKRCHPLFLSSHYRLSLSPSQISGKNGATAAAAHPSGHSRGPIIVLRLGLSLPLSLWRTQYRCRPCTAVASSDPSPPLHPLGHSLSTLMVLSFPSRPASVRRRFLLQLTAAVRPGPAAAAAVGPVLSALQPQV